MKRVYVLLLALLLALTGCAGKTKAKDITVKDVCCPYKIEHKKSEVVLTLHSGENNGIHWQTQAVPEDICVVTQENTGKESSYKYQIAGKEEGAAQLVFSALQEDETILFELILVVNVDSDGSVMVTSNQHRERVAVSAAEGGINYNWNVDVNGTLHFSFTNTEDVWFVQGDGEGICTLTDTLTTPSGCRFSAQAMSAGQTTVRLAGEMTQREIQVVLGVDSEQKLEVVSVQER